MITTHESPGEKDREPRISRAPTEALIVLTLRKNIHCTYSSWESETRGLIISNSQTLLQRRLLKRLSNDEAMIISYVTHHAQISWIASIFKSANKGNNSLFKISFSCEKTFSNKAYYLPI